MSILSELKKLSGKNNATVASEALPLVLPVPTERDTGKCPVVKADGTYELSDAPFELPEVSSEDAGKGLFVDSNGTWGKDYPPTELPAVSSEDSGKGLFVDSNGTWGKDYPPRQVPQPGNNDDGKYLMVSGGQYVFEAPSGNDGVPIAVVDWYTIPGGGARINSGAPTFEECNDALTNGGLVIFRNSNSSVYSFGKSEGSQITSIAMIPLLPSKTIRTWTMTYTASSFSAAYEDWDN